jgi:hypothetical protein
MTPEELLKPRYKVIADYPHSPLRINDILTLAAGPTDLWDCDRTGKRQLLNPADYPAIFKPLQWWEERKPEDMPEYVKDKDNKGRRAYRVLDKSHDFQIWHQDNTIEFRFVYPNGYRWIPATLEEYNEYLSTIPHQPIK